MYEKNSSKTTTQERFDQKCVRGSESCSLSTLKQPPWLNMLAGEKKHYWMFQEGVWCFLCCIKKNTAATDCSQTPE